MALSMYTFVYRMFGEGKENSPFPNRVGYVNWRHACEQIANPEGSDTHREATIIYINQTAERLVDSELKR